METVNCFLQHGSLVATREGTGSVNRDKFVAWAKMFVHHVRFKTEGRRKVRLVYNGFRCHITLRPWEILQNCNVVAYYFPAHTRGKMQPLDVMV